MSEKILRQIIRVILDERANLLIEPDSTSGESTEEVSAVASIGGGPAMPLGAGPHYPGPDLSTYTRISKQVDIAGRAFGGAKPVRRRKRRKKSKNK